ncbi:hypothetical protein HDF26_003853 [Pedobacter cryoconitis]|uniref:Signal peptidase I n=1 Tax=Pedobacter cryoconitis TaxID=188932 RepID=A0A7W8ZKM3_9SPHI|nr:DUF5684 domain-containing protein [Pedobacter cryoconitis]MBB5635733.1 hypothetical protein [Pedobacter cryoconitis]MBB6273393.1 hypothetical protein [Pedobacter cryoconitis]
MDYNSSGTSPLSTGVGVFGGLLYFAILVLVVYSMWRVFEKAGKPGWAAIIPIYNLIILLEIIGKPPIWILWLILPCTNVIFYVWSLNLLAKSFGKSEGFTVGLILLPFIFYPLLAFTDARYLGPSAKEANGFGPNNQFGANNPFGGNNPFGANNPFNQPPNTPPNTPPTPPSSTPIPPPEA